MRWRRPSRKYDNRDVLIRGGDVLIRGGDVLIRGGEVLIRGGDVLIRGRDKSKPSSSVLDFFAPSLYAASLLCGLICKSD